jgi:HEAT repeat protein
VADGSELDRAVLPDPQTLLRLTDWATLGHATGRAEDLPRALTRLTDEDPEVRAQALRYLERVNHQNTIYSATTPAALYLAGILTDPWTVPAINANYPTWRTEYRCLRAVLLDWLGDMAGDASDETVRLAAAHGVALAHMPGIIALRAARPSMFAAISQFLSDEDADVRRSAVVAAGQVADAHELAGHRSELLTPLRDVLANDPDRYHRARAERILLTWVEGPAALAETASSPPDLERRHTADPGDPTSPF